MTGILKRRLAVATVTILAGSSLFLGTVPASASETEAAAPAPAEAATYCGPRQAGFWAAGAPVLRCSPSPKTMVPSISGTAMQGQTLTAARGTAWRAPIGKGFPVEPLTTYQWQRNGVAINGALAATYKLTAADVGQKITVVMLVNIFDGSRRISWTSAATRTVIAPALLNIVKPTVRGLPVVGRTLTAKVGTWRPAGTRYTYQWRRNGNPIKGATASTYRLTRADKGKKVSVKVVAARAGYPSKSALSARTAVVRKGWTARPQSAPLATASGYQR